MTFVTGTSDDLKHVHGSALRKVNGPINMPKNLSLPIFGLAHYKFHGSIWTPNGVHERQQASSLLQAADSWLRFLQVDHPDYRFFVSHSTFWRWGMDVLSLPIGIKWRKKMDGVGPDSQATYNAVLLVHRCLILTWSHSGLPCISYL